MTKAATRKAKNKTARKKVNNMPETSAKQRFAQELGRISSLPPSVRWLGWYWDSQRAKMRLSIPEGVSWLRTEMIGKTRETHKVH